MFRLLMCMSLLVLVAPSLLGDDRFAKIKPVVEIEEEVYSYGGDFWSQLE